MILSRVARVGAARMGTIQRASYSSMWDRVRPSLWHPMATLEQSMMEMEGLASRMMSKPLHYAESMAPRLHKDDDEFFKDLLPKSAKKHKEKHHDKDKEKKHKPKHELQEATRDQGYSSYSYSSSTILDDNGHRVTSVRRRYEDSSGRLKAVHEREIDGMKVKSVWCREHQGDEGEQKTLCEKASSIEEFEEQWKQTPFGQAEASSGGQQGTELPEGVKEAERESEKLTPGPDYEAAEKAPDKECGVEAEGVTKESHEKTREEAIAEGAKTQEEETTGSASVPEYS